jgi:citrate lyase subunit beta / citryl-CoA lyase
MLAPMRARRSCLSVPARPQAKLAKGPTLAADEVVIDLEDSVPPDLKQEAREAVAGALRTQDWEAASVSVRVNGVSTRWCEGDVEATVGAGERVDSIVVPKVERPEDIASVERLLAKVEAEVGRTRPVGIQALIETALGLRNAHEIAAASARLETLILGPADMSVSLGFPSSEEGPRWDYVRGALLVAARAAGLQAIDGPCLQVADLDVLRESAARAREFGYDGKWALHPAQVEPLNEIFAPTPPEVERARAIIDALEREPGRGAVMLEGEMIDEASRKRAKQLLARARAAEAR